MTGETCRCGEPVEAAIHWPGMVPESHPFGEARPTAVEPEARQTFDNADDLIRDLFRNHSKADLIEVIVAQTTAAASAELRTAVEPDGLPLDPDRPMPWVQRISPPFTNRDQELAQAFREAVAQAHQHGTHVEWMGKPLHPLVEDDDYNCPNAWCQRMWAMVREAEDRARLAAPSEAEKPEEEPE